MMVIGSRIFCKKDKKVCSYHNSCSQIDKILTSFDHKVKTAAGLNIIVLSLSYMHEIQKQVKHFKFYENYYHKRRRNIGVCVLND
jgi:hypothetical protein